jgi:hypothetical protein
MRHPVDGLSVPGSIHDLNVSSVRNAGSRRRLIRSLATGKEVVLMKPPKLTTSWVVFAIVAGLLVAGVAVASAHGGGPKRQVIHACVDNQTGVIEIINASGHCNAGESPLDWNGKPQGRGLRAAGIGKPR